MSWWSELWKGKEFEPKVGLCLSGGGARGVIHVGFIKALEEAGIPFHAVSGTSMGAIVGVLAASGMKADEMLEALLELDMDSRTSRLKLLRKVFSNGLEGLYDKLHGYVGTNQFDQLALPCYVTASDLKNGKPVVFHDGDPIHAALASASIPLIFQPYAIKNQVYVDGGLFNNFPVDPLIKDCTHIIGSHANHISPVDSIDGMMDVGDRVFRLSIFQNVRFRMELCDAVIDPPSARSYGTLDFQPEKLKALFEVGYKEGKAQIKEIKEKLKSESELVEKREKFRAVVKVDELGMS